MNWNVIQSEHAWGKVDLFGCSLALATVFCSIPRLSIFKHASILNSVSYMLKLLASTDSSSQVSFLKLRRRKDQGLQHSCCLLCTAGSSPHTSNINCSKTFLLHFCLVLFFDFSVYNRIQWGLHLERLLCVVFVSWPHCQLELPSPVLVCWVLALHTAKFSCSRKVVQK